MLDDRAAARQLAFLERVVRATAEQVDHDQLLRRIIDEATEATDTQVCSLYLWEDAEKVLILTATNGLAQSGVGQVRLGLGEGVTGWVAAQRAPLAVPDVRAEPRFTWVANLDQERFRSMLSVPIVSHDRVIGVMNVQTTDVHDYLPAEVEFVQVLAAQVAGIIELSALRLKLGRQLTLEHEAVERLTSLNASKSDLLAMLSHDFRGPLSIAKSYVFGLMARLSEPDLEACRELESELDSLARMTDNLMLSLELEAQHQLVLDLEEFDMVDSGPGGVPRAAADVTRARHCVRAGGRHLRGDRRPLQDPLGDRQSGRQRHEVLAQRRTRVGRPSRPASRPWRSPSRTKALAWMRARSKRSSSATAAATRPCSTAFADTVWACSSAGGSPKATAAQSTRDPATSGPHSRW